MKTLARSMLFAAVLTAAAVPARAADTAAISVRDALTLASGLRNLDGRLQIIKQPGGGEGTVMVPWEFGSGSFRLRIANDLAIVAAVEKSSEEVRQAIVRELLKRTPGETGLKVGTPEYDEFQKQFNQVLDSPAPGARDLSRIKASELKLDKNEIPVTVLQALKPILDQD